MVSYYFFSGIFIIIISNKNNKQIKKIPKTFKPNYYFKHKNMMNTKSDYNIDYI